MKHKRQAEGIDCLPFGSWPFCAGTDAPVLGEQCDKMHSALKVIYTWASVEREAMNHHHVMKLIERTLNMGNHT